MTDEHEPRQVRKEATVSDFGCVVGDSTLSPRFFLEDLAQEQGLELELTDPPYFTFPSLKSFPVTHGVFTRLGGHSFPPYYSLNVSISVGDNPDHVNANMESIKRAMDLSNLFWVNQVHGNKVIILERPDQSNPLGDADAIVTALEGIGLMIKQADCQGIFIYDQAHHVVGIVHCGWRGNATNIISATIGAMIKRFKTDPRELIVAIGPSLGPCCAQYQDYKELFPSFFHAFKVNSCYFDFQKLSLHQLTGLGVLKENISVCTLCTKCNSQVFFSHRAERPTGRFASVIALKPRSRGL